MCVIVDILYLCVCIRLSMSYKSLCDQVTTTTTGQVLLIIGINN